MPCPLARSTPPAAAFESDSVSVTKGAVGTPQARARLSWCAPSSCAYAPQPRGQGRFSPGRCSVPARARARRARPRAGR
jgi:hypothetical protein